MKKCDGSLQVCPGSCCVHCVEGDGVGEQPPGQCPATIPSPEQLTLFYRQGIVRAANSGWRFTSFKGSEKQTEEPPERGVPEYQSGWNPVWESEPEFLENLDSTKSRKLLDS